MRTRTQGTFTTLPPFEEQRIWNSCSETNWVVSYTESSPKVGKVKTFEDVVTPRWNQVKRKGEYVFNPMRSVERDVFQSSVGYVIEATATLVCGGVPRHLSYRSNESTIPILLKRVTGFPIGVDGTISVPVSPIISQADIDRMVSEASTKTRAKIRTGDAGGWESVAEFGKTISLLRHPLDGAYKLTKSLKALSARKKGSKWVRSGADLLAIPASEWLKYRYGILPLINDIKAVMKALNSQSRNVRKTERATVSASGFSDRDLVSVFGVITTTFSERRKHKITVRAMSVDDYVATPASDLGLSLDQIPKTAWDLIPFSFVADWFANVGDFLNACTPRPGVTHIGGCYTIEESIQSDYFVKSAAIGSGYTSSYTLKQEPSGLYSEKRNTKTRLVGLKDPALVIKSDFRLDNSVRIADAAALISQQLRGLVVSRR